MCPCTLTACFSHISPHAFARCCGPTDGPSSTVFLSKFDAFLIVSHDSIRGCVRPSLRLLFYLNHFVWRAETKTANDLFRGYELVIKALLFQLSYLNKVTLKVACTLLYEDLLFFQAWNVYISLSILGSKNSNSYCFKRLILILHSLKDIGRISNLFVVACIWL